MPFSITIEDFEGETLAEFLDERGILTYILNYCYEHPSEIKVMKYIDLYDDTVLNSLQVKDFIEDIFFLQQLEFKSDLDKSLFKELLSLAQLCLQNV